MKVKEHGVTYGKANRFGRTWILYIDSKKRIRFVALKPKGLMLISEMEDQWIAAELLADHFLVELQNSVYANQKPKLSVVS